ncbi:glycosyltransferase family 39 protein [Candidatus Woesearchaeota archaeon]|nr:glycosyltransferase family 39 protein [Candidatus Woesearchaeota archaeon]
MPKSNRKKEKKQKKKKTTQPELGTEDILKIFVSLWPLAILLAILVFGFYLRLYHYQYPVIGYHNWKTTHYITEARNFAREGFFKEGFFVPMRDTTESIYENPTGAHYDTFPAISIIVGAVFKLFGISLSVARLTNIFLSLGSVAAFYLLIKELFKREDIALLCAFLAAVNPLYVFFSHNVQVVNPGILFMLLGSFFYIRWINQDLKKNHLLYLAVFFIMLACITKYTFAVISIPVLITFPYKRIFRKKETFIAPGIISGIIASGFPLWFIYSEFYLKNTVYKPGIDLPSGTDSLTGLIDLSLVFNSQFWQIIKSYVADNFTLLGMVFMFLGLLLFIILFFTKNKDKMSYRFIFGYSIALFVFIFVMGFKLSSHNYHQFPVAPLIIFMIAFFIDVAAKNIANFVNDSNLKKTAYIAVIILLFIIPLSQGKNFLQHMQDSRDRMFNTQFPGLDIAGEYINQHALPDDRVFHSSGQSFGILWHADRKGYKPPANVEYFMRAESEFNVSWVFAYQWGLQNYFQNPEIFEYLKNNYRLVQFAYIPQGEQAQPLYFLFRKGGSFNDSQLNEMLQDKQILVKNYQRTDMPYEVRFINLE